VKLQSEIWSLAVSSSQKSATPQAMMLLLPALNAMIDITTTRTEAARIHSPLIIWVMLGALTFACALFAGYDMASRKHLNLFHSAAFAVVLAVTVYVIIDLEYPRIGLIQMSDSDHVLVDLRESMK
jgi:FtsH-binding integral membrane protein